MKRGRTGITSGEPHKNLVEKKGRREGGGFVAVFINLGSIGTGGGSMEEEENSLDEGGREGRGSEEEGRVGGGDAASS
jgi:hypothetical protein